MAEKDKKPSSGVAALSEEDADALPPQIKQLLENEGLDPNDPRVSGVLVRAVKTSVFSGPLPSPEVLADYENAHPGLAKEIVGWTGKQIDHRMALEKDAVGAESKEIVTGQWITGGLAIFGLAMAAVVGVWGSPIASAIIATAAVGGPTAGLLARGKRAGDGGSSGSPRKKDQD